MSHVDALSRAPVNLLITNAAILEAQRKADLKPINKQIVHNDIICYQRKGIKRPIVPKELIPQVLKSCHEELGHPGIQPSLQYVTKRFYWSTLEPDVKQHVRTCHQCQLVKPALHATYGQLKPLETPDEPMRLLAMDTIVMGSVAKTSKAKYIQVLIDHHSRYVWAQATPTNTAAAAINVLKNAFTTLTPPANSRFITDNGTNFISKEFNRFLKQHNIQHSYTSTYHPQTNGLNEKVNHTIITRLKIAINEKPKRKWSTLLPEVIYSYNATIHSVTGFAPKYLLFGITDNTQTESNLTADRKLAVERTEAFKKKKKSKYDKTHKHIDLEIGSLVKRRIPSNHPTNNKLTPAYTGPYRVVSKQSDHNYEIKDSENAANSIKVHVSQLEPYFPRNGSASGRGE
jgi:hypothetical protein